MTAMTAVIAVIAAQLLLMFMGLFIPADVHHHRMACPTWLGLVSYV